MMTHYSNGMPFWMALLPMIFWLAVAMVALVLLWPRLRGPQAPPDSPERIAERRYADGQIDRAQFEELIETLRRSRADAATDRRTDTLKGAT